MCWQGTPGRGHANGGRAGRRTLGALEEYGERGQVAEDQATTQPKRSRRKPKHARSTW